MKFLSLKLM